MSKVSTLSLESNRQIKINFKAGGLSLGINLVQTYQEL